MGRSGGKKLKRDYTFKEIVDAFDRESHLDNTNGVAFAFIDGSGSDCASEADVEEWHTFSLFFAPQQLLTIDTSTAAWPKVPSKFMKWSGKQIPSGQTASNAAVAKYKWNVISEFCSPQKPGAIWMHSWSYQTRTLLALKSELFEYFGIGPMGHKDSNGYYNTLDGKWRTMIHHRGWNGDDLFTCLEGNFLVILFMAYQIIFVKKILDNVTSDVNVNKPKGMILITDPLCGDSRNTAKAKFGCLLYFILNKFCEGQINVRSSREAMSKIGEILVDNLAGCLNESIKSDPVGHFNKYSKMLYNAQMANFSWRVLAEDVETQHLNGTTRTQARVAHIGDQLRSTREAPATSMA